MLNMRACRFLPCFFFFFIHSLIHLPLPPFFLYLSVCRSSHSVSQSLRQAVSLSACPSIRPSVCPSVRPSVHPSIHPTVCRKQQMTVYFKGSRWKPWATWREWTTRRSSNVMFLLNIFIRYLDTQCICFKDHVINHMLSVPCAGILC